MNQVVVKGSCYPPPPTHTHRVLRPGTLVRADHFPYPTAAGNAAPRRPQTAPVTQWHSLAAGMRCRGAARVAGSCHCVPLG
jgi:hypothetical protein